MSTTHSGGPVILLVDDVEEALDGFEKLLRVEGYEVEPARSEERAVECARRRPPQLILLNLDGSAAKVIAAARRIRALAQLDHSVPMVLFCFDAVAEGAEVDFGNNVYVTRPDNFDQLRAFIRRLLHDAPTEP